MDQSRVSFKLVLVGSTGVGKSRLLERFTRNDFAEHSTSTYGVEYATKRVTVADGVFADLRIWDTAGQPKYRAIANAYYKGASGVLLVYDVSAAHTFDDCATWLAEVRAHAAEGVPVLLVGNKIDLAEAGSRAVPQDWGRVFAEEHELAFAECSARTGTGVTEAFTELIGEMWKQEQAAAVAAEAMAQQATDASSASWAGGTEPGGLAAAGAASAAAGVGGGAERSGSGTGRGSRRGGCLSWLCCCCCCCCSQRESRRDEASALLADPRGPPAASRRGPPKHAGQPLS